MKAEMEWKGGMLFSGVTESGHEVRVDAGPGGGGVNSAPSPMELVLIALMGCTGMDVVSILQKMKTPIKGLRLSVEAERATQPPRVYTSLKLRYSLYAPKTCEQEFQKAVELSQKKYCSVSAMLKKTANISYFLEVIEDGTA